MNLLPIIDFFDEAHRKEICSNAEFGICDGDNEYEMPAYLSLEMDNKTNWGATVVNNQCKNLSFLPVDNSISILRPDGSKEKRCDGILFIREESQKSIYFIELKERTDKQSKTWRNDGIKQLIATITIFCSNHRIEDFNPRNAYVCNRKRPYYVYSNREELSNFRKKYHVSLYIQPTVEVE